MLEWYKCIVQNTKYCTYIYAIIFYGFTHDLSILDAVDLKTILYMTAEKIKGADLHIGEQH